MPDQLQALIIESWKAGPGLSSWHVRHWFRTMVYGPELIWCMFIIWEAAAPDRCVLQTILLLTNLNVPCMHAAWLADGVAIASMHHSKESAIQDTHAYRSFL